MSNNNNKKKKNTLDSVYGAVIVTKSLWSCTRFIECTSVPMTADRKKKLGILNLNPTVGCYGTLCLHLVLFSLKVNTHFIIPQSRRRHSSKGRQPVLYVCMGMLYNCVSIFNLHHISRNSCKIWMFFAVVIGSCWCYASTAGSTSVTVWIKSVALPIIMPTYCVSLQSYTWSMKLSCWRCIFLCSFFSLIAIVVLLLFFNHLCHYLHCIFLLPMQAWNRMH